jgi:hypothetical protein
MKVVISFEKFRAKKKKRSLKDYVGMGGIFNPKSSPQVTL